MSILSASDGEAGLAIAGSAISMLGSGAFFTGLGSLGPNMRLDNLQRSGMIVEASSAQPETIEPPALDEMCWALFSELNEQEQHQVLRQRRNSIESEGEPYRMMLSLETCPSGYEHVRHANFYWQVCYNPALMPENEPCAAEE